MVNFDAAHAWDLGYYYAVCGIIKSVPRGTWMTRFPADWIAGYEQAIHEGKWGSWNGN